MQILTFPFLNLSEQLQRETLTIDALKPYAIMLKNHDLDGHRFLDMVHELAIQDFSSYVNFLSAPHPGASREQRDVLAELKSHLLAATPLEVPYYALVEEKFFSEEFIARTLSSFFFQTRNEINATVFLFNRIFSHGYNGKIISQIMSNNGFQYPDIFFSSIRKICPTAPVELLKNLSLLTIILPQCDSLRKELLQAIPEFATEVEQLAIQDDSSDNARYKMIDALFPSLAEKVFRTEDHLSSERISTAKPFMPYAEYCYKNLLESTVATEKEHNNHYARAIAFAIIYKRSALALWIFEKIESLSVEKADHIVKAFHDLTCELKCAELKYLLSSSRHFKDCWPIIFRKNHGRYVHEASINTLLGYPYLGYLYDDTAPSGFPFCFYNMALSNKSPIIDYINSNCADVLLQHHLHTCNVANTYHLEKSYGYLPTHGTEQEDRYFDLLSITSLKSIRNPRICSYQIANDLIYGALSYRNIKNKISQRNFCINLTLIADTYLGPQKIAEIKERSMSETDLRARVGYIDHETYKASCKAFMDAYRKGSWDLGIYYLLAEHLRKHSSSHCDAFRDFSNNFLNFPQQNQLPTLDIVTLFFSPNFKSNLVRTERYAKIAENIENIHKEKVNSRKQLLLSQQSSPASKGPDRSLRSEERNFFQRLFWR